jgi:hypothetical protein
MGGEGEADEEGSDGRRRRGSDAGGEGCGGESGGWGDAAARAGGGVAAARVGRGGGADAVRCEEFFPRAGAARTGGMRGRCGNSPISMYLWDNFFWVS